MSRLVLNTVDFGYRPGTKTLREVTAVFEPGRLYAVVGPNGSGKTTLLDLICGFLRPDSGCIELDGKRLSEYRKPELARQIAMVSQDSVINFPYSVRDVVMMGRHPHIPRFSRPGKTDYNQVQNAMKISGIAPLKDRKATELSGGERQRTLFARALCQDTPILLLDEAFSSLDIRHTLSLLHQVRILVQRQGKTVISVFHDLNMASFWADDIIMLHQGRVHLSGPSQTIITPENIAAVFGVNALVNENPELNRKQVLYPHA